MNKQESDILNVILQYHCRNQRALAERCGFSLGMVNRSVKALQGQGFLTTEYMVNNSSSRKRYASPKAGTELYLDLVFRQ